MPTRPVTVGTTATPVFVHNNRRTAWSLANEDTATIFVSEDETNVLAGGYPILAGGALDNLRALGGEPQNVLFAISAAGSADLRVLESFGELPPLVEPAFTPFPGEGGR